MDKRAVDKLAKQATDWDHIPPPATTNTSKQPAESKALGVRQIPIPQRENGYSNFETRVLTSKGELESFLNEVTEKRGWNAKDEFLTNLRNAKIDFHSEVLLLIRTTVGSGSIKISLAEPTIVDGDIEFRVTWKMPGISTDDMNYQCFAVTVPKAAATSARIVTVLVPVPDVSRGRDFTVAPQIIPLSHSVNDK